MFGCTWAVLTCMFENAVKAWKIPMKSFTVYNLKSKFSCFSLSIRFYLETGRLWRQKHLIDKPSSQPCSPTKITCRPLLVRPFEVAPAITDSHLTLGARIEFPLEPWIFNHQRALHTYTNTRTHQQAAEVWLTWISKCVATNTDQSYKQTI